MFKSLMTVLGYGGAFQNTSQTYAQRDMADYLVREANARAAYTVAMQSDALHRETRENTARLELLRARRAELQGMRDELLAKLQARAAKPVETPPADNRTVEEFLRDEARKNRWKGSR